MLIKSYSTSQFKRKEEFDIGLMALEGKSVSEIAKEQQVSRQHVYNQKVKLEESLEKMSEEIAEKNVIEIKIDDTWLTKAIIVLALDCASSIEGIQSFLEKTLGIHVSIGKISQILSEAGKRAKDFDSSIDLSSIDTGANDEIFQCNEPVLVGVDPKTTYIYLMEASKDRTAETWEKAFEEPKKAGLNLELSVNDGGSGLSKGIPNAFPGIQIQADVFHPLYEVGKGICALERRAINAIKAEEELLHKCMKEIVRSKTWDKYEKAEHEAKEAVRKYDIAYILYTWLCEVLGVTGYNIDETVGLIEYITKELEMLSTSKSLEKGIKFIREHAGQLLQFAVTVEVRTKELPIPNEISKLLLRQLRYGYDSIEYNKIEVEIGNTLKGQYAKVRESFCEIIADVVRASSIVENVNSRLRVYMNLKRIIPTSFISLLKVYFNTKKFRRSRCEERVGKSPLDLLTNKDNPDMLHLLGY